MIYSAGSVVEHEDGTVSEEVDDGTPILLFCRNLGVVRFPVCFFSFRIHLSIVSLTFFLWAFNNCVIQCCHCRAMFTVAGCLTWRMHQNGCQSGLSGSSTMQTH